MKKLVAITLVLAMCLCLGVTAMAADSYTVTLINGMDDTVYGTYEVADGEAFVFTISCAAPADMGAPEDGAEGSGVTATVGDISYSDITLGGPNDYPTEETVTITGITEDVTVTVTPNPDEVESEFPAITVGAGGATDEVAEDASDEAYPLFDEYKEYVYEKLMEDSFWAGAEETVAEALAAAESPEDESLQNFIGVGDVDQAPSGVEFPMSYEEWYAVNGETVEATGELSGEPSGEVSAEPSGEVSAEPSGEVSEEPSGEVSAEPSGEVSEEPSGEVSEEPSGEVSAEPSGEASGEASEEIDIEAAYVEYIHEWLLAENEINSTMTEDIVENEFMPLVEAGDFTTFPAEMLFNGMLESGVPMTFEEFAEQYDAGEAGSDTSEAAYQAYLIEFAESCEDIQTSGAIDEFISLIEAGDYVSFPVEMLFDATWYGEAALSYDEFVAAGGNVTVVDHPSNGAMPDDAPEV